MPLIFGQNFVKDEIQYFWEFGIETVSAYRMICGSVYGLRPCNTTMNLFLFQNFNLKIG